MYVELKKVESKINYLLKTYVKSPQLTKKFKDALKSLPIADVVPTEDVAKDFTCVFGTPHKVSECPMVVEVEDIDQIAKEMLEGKDEHKED